MIIKCSKNSTKFRIVDSKTLGLPTGNINNSSNTKNSKLSSFLNKLEYIPSQNFQNTHSSIGHNKSYFHESTKNLHDTTYSPNDFPELIRSKCTSACSVENQQNHYSKQRYVSHENKVHDKLSNSTPPNTSIPLINPRKTYNPKQIQEGQSISNSMTRLSQNVSSTQQSTF
ncbi:hypothetical protein QTN25_006523 [Entamoeba marina]